MEFTDEQRRRISEETVGKVVNALWWTRPEETDLGDHIGYWTIYFTDGTELSFRMMPEIETEPETSASADD